MGHGSLGGGRSGWIGGRRGISNCGGCREGRGGGHVGGRVGGRSEGCKGAGQAVRGIQQARLHPGLPA